MSGGESQPWLAVLVGSGSRARRANPSSRTRGLFLALAVFPGPTSTQAVSALSASLGLPVVQRTPGKIARLVPTLRTHAIRACPHKPNPIRNTSQSPGWLRWGTEPIWDTSRSLLDGTNPHQDRQGQIVKGKAFQTPPLPGSNSRCPEETSGPGRDIPEGSISDLRRSRRGIRRL